MTDEKKNLDFALLSWIRLQNDFSNEVRNKKEMQEELQKLTDYLSDHHIKDVEIIYKSKDYYTLRYLREGQTCIKQFTAEEVELHL